MSRAALTQKKAILGRLVDVEAQATQTQLETLVPLVRDLAAVSSELAGQCQRHERQLQRVAPDLPERSHPFRAGSVVHLPQTASGSVPMLRMALQRLFPAYYTTKPWTDVELGELQLGGNVYKLRTSGPGLSVEEADLFLALLHLAGGRTDQAVQTTTWEVLALLGRSSGGDSCDTLHQQLDRLTRTHFSTTDARGRKVGRQWLAVRDYTTLAPESPHVLQFVIDPRFAALYAQGRAAWTPVDLAQRIRIDGRAKLVRWLALVLSSYGTPNTTPVDRLYAWSGSAIARPNAFRAELLRACKRLEEPSVGLLVPGTSHVKQGSDGYLLHIQKRAAPARFDHRHPQVELLTAEGAQVLLSA